MGEGWGEGFRSSRRNPSSPALLPEGEGKSVEGKAWFRLMDHNSSDWIESETTKHQDHVIAHVIGATVLGWFIAGEAAHLLLDIGFLWTIYLDGEMNLLPQGVAISELDAAELTSADKTEVAFDAQLLLSEGLDAFGLKRFTASPVECLITGVDFLTANSERRVVIHSELARISVETSLETAEVVVFATSSA
jgi:hypothetical protein